MPFDSIGYAPNLTDLDRLVIALRDRSQWPKDFRWSYTRCETCAIGLAFALGLKQFSKDMTRTTYENIFHKLRRHDVGNEVSLSAYEVSPDIVADAICQWQAKQIGSYTG